MGFMFLTNSVEAYNIRYDDNDSGAPQEPAGSGESPSGGGSGGSGCSTMGNEFTTWLSNALKFTQYAGVGLAVILTAVDFIQVIGGSKDDDLKKAFDRTVKRLIAVVLLLLTTVLVNFVITTFINPVIDGNVENCIPD